MKPRFAMMALTATLAAPIALAQQVPTQAPLAVPPQPANMNAGGLRPVTSVPPLSATGTASPASSAAGAKPAPVPTSTDARVFGASTELPAPVIPDANQPPNVVLPNDPIEPFLLTRDAGPFMVMAKTFRGPDAERWALALVLELQHEYHLPAYILRTRDFPMRSNIRNVPPTAVKEARKPYLAEPEKSRTHDEAVVLVGNEKTLKDSEALLHKVKKIKPKCLNNMQSIYPWRQGLGTALRTTNPYVPAQELFAGKGDEFVAKLNSGPFSVFHCPGRYTLQVAEYGGRSTFNLDEKKTNPLDGASPLEQAYENAEKLAEVLAKDPEVRKTGCLPYVYHDRTTSKVLMGAFNSPDDPAAAKLRDAMLRLAIPLAQKKKTDMMIVPAPFLTDVEVLRASAK